MMRPWFVKRFTPDISHHRISCLYGFFRREKSKLRVNVDLSIPTIDGVEKVSYSLNDLCA